MDIVKAKAFIYSERASGVIYHSTDFYSILEVAQGEVAEIKAIIDTPGGEMLCDMGESYGCEPIIMRPFMHYDSYIQFTPNMKNRLREI